MPLGLEAFDDADLCKGHVWTVVDRTMLVSYLASLALGHYRHIHRILLGDSASGPEIISEAIDGAIEALTVPDGSDPWHRDGWLFQLISWIAARVEDPSSVASIPHAVQAHKGLDGMFLKIVDDRIETMTICEDKATTSPRDTIRDDVWPELERFERNERLNLIISEATALLERAAVHSIDELLSSRDWEGERRYRVAITAGSTHKDKSGRATLFAEFDTTVKGAHTRRIGEAIYLYALRDWFKKLAAEVRAELERRRP